MKPTTGHKTKFRKETKYQHMRSEGLTDRKNGGSKYQLHAGRGRRVTSVPCETQGGFASFIAYIRGGG